MKPHRLHTIALLAAATLAACHGKSTSDTDTLDPDDSWLYEYSEAPDTTPAAVDAWLHTVSLDSIERLLCRHNGDILIDGTNQRVYFKDVLRCREDAMKYPFSELADSLDMSSLTSDDGRLRIFTWNTGMGGTCPDIARLTLLRGDDGRLHFINRDLDNPYLLALHTLHDGQGRTVYLLYNYFREWSTLGSRWVATCRINGDTLIHTSLFPHGDSTLGTEHTIPDWYFKTNYGEGWDWLFDFDGRNLYVPLTDEELELTDRYDLYRWNGNCFDSLGQVGNYRLHPSLGNYATLAAYFVTRDYRVRVDRMADGSYRYASWRRNRTTDTKPDLVIPGGRHDEERGCYIFENEGYTYRVGDISFSHREDDGDSRQLIVERDGHILLRQAKEYE